MTPLAKLVTTDVRRPRTEGGHGPRGVHRRCSAAAARARAGRRHRADPHRPRCPARVRSGRTMTCRRGSCWGPAHSRYRARVMRAMQAAGPQPPRPEMMALLEEVRAPSGRVFGAGPDSFSFAVSGTGTSGMETAVANLTAPGTRAAVVVTGYFGDRLAQMLQRYGADVIRVEVEWGRACDPAAVERALAVVARDIVAVVHAETSTGVLNPVKDILASLSRAEALTIVDAVTSLGAIPLECRRVARRRLLQLLPERTRRAVGPRADRRSRRGRSQPARPEPQLLFRSGVARGLLERPQIPPHHLGAARLCPARSARCSRRGGARGAMARHQRNHAALVDGLAALGLQLLPPEGERLWTLNAVRVPDGVDEAAVRATCSSASTSRSAPVSVRWPERSGASV